MITILRSETGVILGAGERDDWLPVDGQTTETLDTTLLAYAGRFHLASDRASIRADGLDAATVTVSTSLPLDSVDVLVNGMPETVPLANGVGTLTISAEVAGTLVVEPADPVQFCRAGAGTLAIVAEEVA